MYATNRVKPLLVILGPTGVGKTEISIQLAQRLGAEIISADSRLFYKGMDIGTAKPTLQERALVPHYMIDVVSPDETWNLMLFQKQAQQLIAEIHARGRLPMLVGGTGQYIRAVIENWSAPEQPPDIELRSVLDVWAGEIGKDELHRKLTLLDPNAAAQIDSRNLRRTVRALEVIFKTGRKFSEQRKQNPSPYSLLLIGLKRPRPELYARIDDRIERMITDGLIDEVRFLLLQGYPPDLPAFSAIGYREMIAFLCGEISLQEAVMLMKRGTRQFIRRQANWFKESDPKIHWFRVTASTVDEIEKLLEINQLL
jgi:tRNA dimethylallyltransferase